MRICVFIPPKLHIDYMCIRQDVFCDYMQYLLFITTSHICIQLSVYVSPFQYCAILEQSFYHVRFQEQPN